jgi:hypothetical protein
MGNWTKMVQKRKIAVTLLLLGMLGCVPEDDNSSNTQGQQDPDDQTVCDVGELSEVCSGNVTTSINLFDQHNYYFTSNVDISSKVIRGGSPIVDLTFDWSGVTRDFMGHALDPLRDINMVVVTAWFLSQAELIDMLNRDEMNQTKLLGAVMAYPYDMFTSENLLDFTLLGNPLTNPADIATRDSYFNATDPEYDPNLYTHMVMVQSNEMTPGKSVRMIQFFTLDANSTDTQINITTDSTKLTYEVDMRSQSRIPVPLNTPTLSVNWENVSKNASGFLFVPNRVDRVVVAHYSMSVCELEDNFLDLETIHDKWYYFDLENVSVSQDLTALKTADGVPFPGITADGIWILGLFCTLECSNPAPIFMTILHPC